MNFSNTLISWYQQNQRNLPWRNTQNPYYIWLSEIILQQTRVAQGLAYYQSFTDLFPTIQDLAEADEALVLKTWQGLGYYSRARNLHATAKNIQLNFDGIFPNTYKDILQLKGIGPYTAAAIASFAYKEPISVVDGNVFRVFARYFGIHDDISQAKSRKIFQELGNDLIDSAKPDVFNQALMDFGATLCKPKNPDCDICPFQETCYAYRNNVVSQLPVKNKVLTVKKRFFDYVVIENDGEIYINKRLEKDIWNSLYEFPLTETEKPHSLEDTKKILAQQYKVSEVDIIQLTEPIKHKLSHQLLHITFWKIDKNIELPFEKVPLDVAKEYAFPIVIWNHIVSKF